MLACAEVPARESVRLPWLYELGGICSVGSASQGMRWSCIIVRGAPRAVNTTYYMGDHPAIQANTQATMLLAVPAATEQRASATACLYGWFKVIANTGLLMIGGGVPAGCGRGPLQVCESVGHRHGAGVRAGSNFPALHGLAVGKLFGSGVHRGTQAGSEMHDNYAHLQARPIRVRGKGCPAWDGRRNLSLNSQRPKAH